MRGIGGAIQQQQQQTTTPQQPGPMRGIGGAIQQQQQGVQSAQQQTTPPEQLAGGPMRGIGGAIQRQQQSVQVEGTQQATPTEQMRGIGGAIQQQQQATTPQQPGPMRGIGGAIQQQQQGAQSPQQTTPPEQFAGGPMRGIGGSIQRQQQPAQIEGTRQTTPAQLDPTACPPEPNQAPIECICNYVDANDAEASSGGGPYSVQQSPSVAPVTPAAAKANAPQDNACVGGVQFGGDCRCPEGELAQRFSDRTVCVPSAAPAKSGATPLRAPAAASLPAACSGGQLGSPPNCYCPSGTQWTGRECQLVAVQPPVQLCPPGLTAIQGQCVRLAIPRSFPFDPGPGAGGGGNTQSRTPSESAARPACPPDRPVGTYPNCCPAYTVSDGRGGCGGSDTVQKGGVSVPPPGAKIPVPSSTTSQNVLTRGGGGAAGAIRANPCQSWQVLRNGVCACPIGMTGSRCEQVLVR
jgi:hypothetical protein